MEIMKAINKESNRYASAKKRVKEIKGFYGHLLGYILVNIVIIIISAPKGDLLGGFLNIWNYITAFLWGIGVFAHWATVFGPSVFFIKSWEERKIKEIMEKDKRKIWE